MMAPFGGCCQTVKLLGVVLRGRRSSLREPNSIIYYSIGYPGYWEENLTIIIVNVARKNKQFKNEKKAAGLPLRL